jgi:hypothetical protein
MKPYVLSMIGFAFLLIGCDRGARLIRTEPHVTEVAGRYTFSHSKFGGRVDSEILSTAKEAYIDLKTNGEVVLHKVPIVAESSSGSFSISEFRTGSGTFEISAMGSTAKNNIYGAYLSVGKLPDPMGHPWFKRKGQSLVLSFDYFDGDFTDRMVFIRDK